jgi:hypothetical protein
MVDFLVFDLGGPDGGAWHPDRIQSTTPPARADGRMVVIHRPHERLAPHCTARLPNSQPTNHRDMRTKESLTPPPRAAIKIKTVGNDADAHPRACDSKSVPRFGGPH